MSLSFRFAHQLHLPVVAASNCYRCCACLCILILRCPEELGRYSFSCDHPSHVLSIQFYFICIIADISRLRRCHVLFSLGILAVASASLLAVASDTRPGFSFFSFPLGILAVASASSLTVAADLYPEFPFPFSFLFIS